MRNVVVTRARNEHAYIDQFIEYYLKIGFDYIYVLIEEDQKYVIDEGLDRYALVVHPYDGTDVIEHIPNLIDFADVDWILHCDVDEFLCLSKVSDLKYWLSQLPSDCGQILLNWVMIENFQSSRNFKDIFETLKDNTLFINFGCKSLFKKEYMVNIPTAHFVKTTLSTYYGKQLLARPFSNLKTETNVKSNLLEGNPFLLHFHTRSLENAFIKGLSYCFEKKTIYKNELIVSMENLLKTNDLDKFINQFRKLELPFKHSLGETLVCDFNFPEMNHLIKNDIEINMIKSLCVDMDICFDSLSEVICLLEAAYYDRFTTRKDFVNMK